MLRLHYSDVMSEGVHDELRPVGLGVDCLASMDGLSGLLDLLGLQSRLPWSTQDSIHRMSSAEKTRAVGASLEKCKPAPISLHKTRENKVWLGTFK